MADASLSNSRGSDHNYEVLAPSCRTRVFRNRPAGPGTLVTRDARYLTDGLIPDR